MILLYLLKDFLLQVFSNNIGKDYGGAITEEISEIIFWNNSTVTFSHNNAPFGETVYCGSNSNVTSKGNSTVTFNDVLAKWCTNMTCLPYNGQGAVIIDSNGIVWCSDKKAFTCLTESCNCKTLQYLLYDLHDGASNVVVNLTDKAILSSVVELEDLRNVSIIGENNFTVLCDRSYIEIHHCDDLTFQGITWIGCGTPNLLYNYVYPVMNVIDSSVFIQKNTFQYSFGPALHFLFVSSDFTMANCSFMNSNYRGHGAAIKFYINYYPSYKDVSIINNCDFSYNEGVKSIVYFGSSDSSYNRSVYFNNTTFYNNQGVSILFVT